MSATSLTLIELEALAAPLSHAGQQLTPLEEQMEEADLQEELDEEDALLASQQLIHETQNLEITEMKESVYQGSQHAIAPSTLAAYKG
jgi:hypothetical protein